MRKLLPLADRGPLRVMFVHTIMPMGGAETLLLNLIRRLDPERVTAEACCLKSLGPLGETLAEEIPVFSGQLRHKYDLRVLPRLTWLLRQRRIDAVVTVGAGDRMFWGRLAARAAGAPVILTALHSTGWPDVVGRLNKKLTRITDGFIAVAQSHGRYLADVEGFPPEKVFVIPNGVDIRRFRPQASDGKLRRRLGLPEGAPVVGIVAALRPEKDHGLFLRVAARVRQAVPNAEFLIVGDGEIRPALVRMCRELNIIGAVHFLGTRNDVPNLLAMMDVVALTSKMEASPVTILEAMAMEKPFVAPRVGSIPETIIDGQTGYLVDPGDECEFAHRLVELLSQPERAKRLGAEARRRVVEQFSLESMVAGYQDLITQIYLDKLAAHQRRGARPAAAPTPETLQVLCDEPAEEARFG